MNVTPISSLHTALQNDNIVNLPDDTLAKDVLLFNNGSVAVNNTNTPDTDQHVTSFVNSVMDDIALHNQYNANQNLYAFFDDGVIPDDVTLEQLREIDDTTQTLDPTKAERRQEMMALLTNHMNVPNGVSAQIPGQVADDNGVMRDLYQYTGLVFRADTRTMQDLRNDGGFNSQNDLSVARNLQEAQGIRSDGRGATGHSGVSCASNMEGAYEYGRFDDENNRARMFVVDTRLIGNETAYDMSAIVTNNNGFGPDNTGNEVNLTSAPTNAIVGYIEFSPELTSYQAPTFTANPTYNQ